MKKIFVFLLLIMAINVSNAGIDALTIHSRANCVNNESITWHRNHYYDLLTVSDHLFHGQLTHSLAAPWEHTWRSANVHWGEGTTSSLYWYVQAGHYQRFGATEFRIGFTTASSCNIYDGWWD